MKITSTIIIICFLFNSLSAQEIPQNPNIMDEDGLRQGKWTIWYNSEWETIDNPDSLVYYRLIEYIDDKPVDTVRDFYRSGKIQWKGLLLADRPESVNHGKAIYYREDGSISSINTYDSGKLVNQTQFDKKGNEVIPLNTLNQKAMQAYQAGNLDEAIQWFEKIVERAADEMGKNHPDYVTSISNLGFMYSKQGLNKKAEPIFVELKNIKEKELGKNHPEYAAALNNLAFIFEAQQRYNKAEQLFIESKNIHKNVYGKNHASYATLLSNLAELYKAQNKYIKAEPLFLETLIIRKKVLGESHQDYSNTLNNLAELYMSQGKYENAEPLFIEARTNKKKNLGVTHLSYIVTLDNLAKLYEAQGLYNKAEPLFIELKNIYTNKFGEDHQNYARALNNLALLYRSKGLYSQAETLFEEAKVIDEKTLGKDHNSYATTIHNLALCYKEQGHYTKAKPLAIEVISIYEKNLGENHPFYATSLDNLSMIYMDQGLYSKAEPLLVKAKNIREETLGKNNIVYATSLNNLAVLYKKKGLYNKAEPYYIEAKNIYKEKLGSSHPDFARSLSNLASLYQAQGKYANAESMYIKAKNIRGKSLGKEHPDYGATLNNLGSLYEDNGLYNKAEPLFVKAKNIANKSRGKEHPDYASSLNNLARIYYSQEQFVKAEAYFTEANSVIIRYINLNFSNLSEREKETFYNTSSGHFNIFHSYVLKRHRENPLIIAEDYKLILATKGLLFKANQKIKDAILNSQDSVLIQSYNEWKMQRAYLSSLYEKTIKERIKMEVDLAEEEAKANKLEEKLSSQSALFASATDDELYSWKDVQNSLAEDEAAIELIRFNYYDKKWTDSIIYAAMIVTPETKESPELVVFPNGTEMENKAYKGYRNSIEYKIEDQYSYAAFWSPIAPHLQKYKKIYLSAEGVYHSISLEGLLNTKTGKYLADEIDIQRVSSTKDLIVAKNQKQLKESVEILGYPSYNTFSENDSTTDEGLDRSLENILTRNTDTRFFTGRNIPMLPGTKKEVENMQSIFNKSGLTVNAYIEGYATEQAVKAWDNPKIAHIATHGYFLQDLTITTEQQRIGGFEREALVENPLLRSGLLLANAKQAFQKGGEGILTAYEARDLKLDETELVVLSACETGLGKVKNGEGVYGLQRAFMAAGASSVIMSLWTVNDEATQELMTSFYKNWLIENQNKRKAFTNAKLVLREKYPHPYYWAAFVMMGE